MKRLLAFVVAAILAAAVLAGGWLYRSPLAASARLSRIALVRAGLAKSRIAGPRGPVTVFAGGRGPTLLLIHGANDQAGAWAGVASPLVEGHRVVAPDLPGHGDSAPAEGPLGVGELVAGLEAVLTAETGGSVALVGNSLGGFLALHLALKHPERVSRVVLVNGAAHQSRSDVPLLPRSRDEARRMLEALTGPTARLPPGFVLDDLVRRSAASPMARLYRSDLEAWRLDERLEGISMPVTLVWGDADELMPVAYAEAARAKLSDARLVTLPGCGHIPMRECPALLAPALMAATEVR